MSTLCHASDQDQDTHLVSVRPRLRTVGRTLADRGEGREAATVISQNIDLLSKLLTAVSSPLSPSKLLTAMTGSCHGPVQRQVGVIDRDTQVNTVEEELQLAGQMELNKKDLSRQVEKQSMKGLEDGEKNVTSDEDSYLVTIRPRLRRNKQIKNICGTVGSKDEFEKEMPIVKVDALAFSDSLNTAQKLEFLDEDIHKLEDKLENLKKNRQELSLELDKQSIENIAIEKCEQIEKFKNTRVTMGGKGNVDKENKLQMVDKDVMAFADAVFAKLCRKTTASIPPPKICSSVSSLLGATADEVQIPTLPRTTLTNLPSNLTLPHSGITALVEQPGFISLKLRQGIVLDLSANLAIRLNNTTMNCNIALSACTTKMALEHPMARILQYGPMVEVQTEDNISVKKAKIFPWGISFTANNMALVYLLETSGVRLISDMFYDLSAVDIVDTLFFASCQQEREAVATSIEQLDNARYYRTKTGVDCWVIGKVFIQQTACGLVIVEREVEGDEQASSWWRKFVFRTDPSNGMVQFDSPFVSMTASLGDTDTETQSHMFFKSGDRTLHYSGQTKGFKIGNGGKSAGIDEEGRFRIF